MEQEVIHLSLPGLGTRIHLPGAGQPSTKVTHGATLPRADPAPPRRNKGPKWLTGDHGGYREALRTAVIRSGIRVGDFGEEVDRWKLNVARVLGSKFFITPGVSNIEETRLTISEGI